MKSKKAPGPDGIPPEVIKAIILKNPEIIKSIMNKCLITGIFPAIWKKATLVLIEKPKKDPTQITAYRPICLLDTAGKFLESLLKKRLEEELNNRSAINENQFGFRRGLSTVDALRRIQMIKNDIDRKAFKNREYCALITIDIKNAFNSAMWDKIIMAMETKGISKYIVRMIQSYLSERTIETTQNGTVQMTCGVPQGSVLGPTLWNILYDRILRVQVEDGVSINAFADDTAIIIKAKTKAELEDKAQHAVIQVTEELKNMGLKIAPAKTEMVILAGRRKLTSMTIDIQGATISSQEHLKYLGVYIDRNIRMTAHVKKICEKSNRTMMALARIMPNLGGPGYRKRRVLANVVISSMLYASPIWSVVLKYQHYINMMEKVNRKLAIRIISAYRTISTSAALVLAGIVPIKIKVKEREAIYQNGREYENEAKNYTIIAWNARWQEYNGWAKTFIKDVGKWYERKWGELDFYTTQGMSGHGVFGSYLHTIGKKKDTTCWYCEEEDTPNHTIFECAHWTEDRKKKKKKCEIQAITAENVAEILLESECGWNAVTGMLRNIMQKKEKDEFIYEQR